MHKRVINIFSNNDEYTLNIKTLLIEKLNLNGFEYNDGFCNYAELNIAIGGDGAYLRAVRESNFSSIPFVGINTGTLGFYPEINPSNLDAFINDYVTENYTLDSISLIESEITTSNSCEKKLAVNDIIIKRKDMKTIHLDVFIASNNLEKISGDGLIISSPMGSSAYNKSAGGSLVYPSLKTLQITPLSPIISNAYRCLDCSVVVPPEFEISIYPVREEDYYVFLLVDGEAYEYDEIECIHFRTSKKVINRLTTGVYNYWEVIKEKFL